MHLLKQWPEFNIMKTAHNSISFSNFKIMINLHDFIKTLIAIIDAPKASFVLPSLLFSAKVLKLVVCSFL